MERELPIICVDVAAIAIEDGAEYILLIKRAHKPDISKLALPGGHVEIEDVIIPRIAIRKFRKETSLRVNLRSLHFLGLLDAPERDPRARIISAVFAVKVRLETLQRCRAGSDAKAIVVRELDSIRPEEMAFDHYKVISVLKTNKGWYSRGTPRRP